MPNRPGNDDRNTATGGQGDRGQRDVSSDSARQNGSQGAGAPARTRSNRGFASMDRDKQKEIASKGGRAAHAKGTAHEFDSGEARDAGRKGGVAVSRNREHMAAIGRRGGEARGHSRVRVPVQASSSAAANIADASFQNSRIPADRQITIDNQNESLHSNTPSTRPLNNPLGTDRRPEGRP
jgi:hypothetical protein